MTFRSVSPDSQYRSVRLLSATGRWTLGLSPYHHGIRIRMGPAGLPPTLLDFCLGHDARLPLATLLAVLRRLESVPENSRQKDIDAAFPWAGTRPNLSLHIPQLLSNREASRTGASPNKTWIFQGRSKDVAFRVDPGPHCGENGISSP